MSKSDWLLKTFGRLSPHHLAVPLLLDRVSGKPGDGSRPTVLCLSRLHFDRDVVQLRRHVPFNWITLRSRDLSLAQGHWVSRKEFPKAQAYFWSASSPSSTEGRKHCLAMGRTLLQGLLKRWKPDAILTANLDYWQEEGLKAAAMAAGVPFLVMSREHYVSAQLRENRMKDYRATNYRFTGTAVSFFGECTVSTLTTTGVCPAERVHVCGAPRLDEWRDFTPDPHARPAVTLLSFSRGYLVESSYAATLLAFARASRRAKASGLPAEFVLKCKNKTDEGNALRILEEVPDHALTITSVVPIVPLLARSRLVIGFNSLSNLEAMLGGAELGTPWWGDADRDPFDLVLDPRDEFTRSVVTFYRSPDEVEARALACAGDGAQPAPREARMKLFRQYFHYPEDHTSCDEIRAFIETYLPGKRGA
jgi:hypothetical protein